MYIKLTRLDNSPIWLNVAFIVTVEPRRGGGSIVVPIGDGLDYDVRETPEQVLALLDGAPAPAVVPVPPPKGLAPTPDDVSPAGGFVEIGPKTAESAPSESSADEARVETPAEEKPVKRTRRTAKKAAEDGDAAPKAPRKTRARAKKSAVEIPDEVVERLRKMMPGSTRKLLNTLVTQFKIEDAEPVVAALQERGVIEVEREHVIWRQEESK